MPRLNFNPSKKTQRILITAVVVLVLGGIFLLSRPTEAGFLGISNDDVAGWLISPFFAIMSLLGKLLVVLIDILLKIANYNDFLKNTVVSGGWIVVRDLCNMFLVIILLIIAWGTVLRLEGYIYRRTLPKFIIMAFLINFSKSIAGFFIDLTQVIMATFVNAFSDAAAGNLTTGAGLQKLLMFEGTIDYSKVDIWDVFTSIILGNILLSVMIGAVVMIIVILLGRILVLWILVVLSPLAYLGETIDKLKPLASQWWKMFGQYVVVGPLLAFFLWLAMTAMTANPGTVGSELHVEGLDESAISEEGSEGSLSATISEVSTTKNLLNFLVVVGLLYGSVMVSNQMKTMGGSFGQKVGMGITGGLVKAPAKAYAWGARKIKAGAVYDLKGKRRFAGVDLNPVSVYRTMKDGFEKKKQDDEADGTIFADQRLRAGHFWTPLTAAGAPGWVDTYARGFLARHGVKAAIAREPMQKLRQKQLNSATENYQGIEKAESEFLASKLAEKKWNDISGDESMALYERRKRISADNPEMTEEEAIDMARREHIAKELADSGDSAYQQILGEKSSAQASVEKLKKKVAGWEALRPRDFEGQKIRRSRVSEASQKQDSTNEEELMSNLVGGLERGDVTDTQAVMYQAAKVQHLNEIVERTRATEDYYEHAEKGLIGEKEYKKMTPAERAEHLLFNGEAVFKKGGGLSASAMGLHAFINETLIKTLKVDPQTAYTIENDLSNIAEQVDQWTMGQANGTKGDGTMYQRTYLDQQARVRTERSKVDAEKLNRGGNRLSTSTEKWVDPFDFSKGRYTDLNPYRVDELKSNPEQILSFLKRGRYNVSEAQHVVRFNMDVINKVVVPAMRNKGMKEADIKEFLAKMGEIGGATKKGVTRDTADTVRESHELIEQQRKEREKSGKPAIKGQHRGMPGI